MKNKFYAVVTKYGHVGNGKYREVTLQDVTESSCKAKSKRIWTLAKSIDVCSGAKVWLDR